MKKTIKGLLAISALVLASSQSFAKGSGDGVLLSINPSYSSASDNLGDSSSANDVSITSINMDLSAGYLMGNGLYLGGLYLSNSGESSTDGGATKQKTSATGMGLSVGYMKNGWLVHAHYILSAEKDDDTSTAGKWTKGTGTQFDFGYIMPISGMFYMGMQLSISSVEYGTSVDSSGTEDTSNKRKVSGIAPKLRFTFIF